MAQQQQGMQAQQQPQAASAYAAFNSLHGMQQQPGLQQQSQSPFGAPQQQDYSHMYGMPQQQDSLRGLVSEALMCIHYAQMVSLADSTATVATQTQTALNHQLAISQAVVPVNLTKPAKHQLGRLLRSKSRNTLINKATCNPLLTLTLTATLHTATLNKLLSSPGRMDTLNKVNTPA